MTTTIQALIASKDAEATQTTQYTSSGKTVIDSFLAMNTTGADKTLSINLIDSGAASSANLVSTRTIESNETYTFPEVIGQVLENGGKISTIASASGITIRASGRVIT